MPTYYAAVRLELRKPDVTFEAFAFELKIGTPVTPAEVNVHTKFGFFLRRFVFE